MRFMKFQEGFIIAGFALATVMIIALLVTYLSNRVVDMIAIQNQVFFSKQAYWNAYSGMELTTSEREDLESFVMTLTGSALYSDVRWSSPF